MISLGVTADSYIVFFERLKDEVRSGKSARSAVQPAFKRAYKTIVAADIVTGIAAVVLYVTAVSSVRGFALTLGVATAARPVRRLVLQAAHGVPDRAQRAARELRGFGLHERRRGGGRPPAWRHRRPAGGEAMNLHHAIETYRGHTIPHFQFTERRNIWFAVLRRADRAVARSGCSGGGSTTRSTSRAARRSASRLSADVTAEQISATMADAGRPDAEVQIVSGDQVSIRTESLAGRRRAPTNSSTRWRSRPASPSTRSTIQDIGPTWGKEISRKALTGLVIVLLAIALYIAFRFEPKMAMGAMIALVHDVVITAGIYALTGREVTPETVIAILTILGYSLYDTVVIYDKIKENTESAALTSRLGYAGVVDLSLNQTLMRSVNTSLVVLLPILSLLLFGGDDPEELRVRDVHRRRDRRVLHRSSSPRPCSRS